MPTITNIDDRGFIRLTLTGSWPTLDELRVLRRVLDSPAAQPRVLADVRGVTNAFPSYDEIRFAIDRVRNNKASAARRRAVLVRSDVQFGIARVFQSLLPGQVEVFRDEESALAWLLAPGDAQARVVLPGAAGDEN